MKKTGIITLSVALILSTAATLYVVTRSEPLEKTDNKLKNSTQKTQAPTTAPTTAVTKGEYVEYSDAKLADTKGTKVLFFHAPWCPQCRALDSDIKATTLPDGVTIFKVDYDTNQALRQKYGVTIQTTLVEIDDSGKLIEKYVAYDDPTYASLKKNLLD